jgi:hypothetical protein
VTGGDVAAAVMQRNAIAAIMNVVARVIAPVHITLSLLCGEQKSTIQPREAVLGNNRRLVLLPTMSVETNQIKNADNQTNVDFAVLVPIAHALPRFC